MKIINQVFIDGQFLEPSGEEVQDLYNPATAELIGQVRLGNKDDVNHAVQAAKRAFKTYSQTTVAERSAVLDRLYNAVTAREEELNQVAVLEYGSPISATRGRTHFAAQAFLDAKDALQQIQLEKDLDRATIVQAPLGVAAAITPWNANYIHICAKIAPALAAGCTIVVKPSEFSALETQILAECFAEADIPPGLINIVNGTGADVGASLCAHPDVAMISFTGSTQTGKAIGKVATETMKRVMLELGGKSPNILLEDCDFGAAIPRALLIAFSNSGQACHAGTRLIIPENKLALIVELLIKAVQQLKIGHLMDADTFIGPMVNRQQYERVQSYIQKGIDEGAQLISGGLGHPKGLAGFYVKPTVFINVTSDMTIAREEIFGPVLSVLTYKTEEEALAIANDTIYGLSAYISAGDAEKAKILARRIESGRVVINAVVNSQSQTPFGGFKQSGIGRSGWTYGIEMHLEPKVIAF